MSIKRVVLIASLAIAASAAFVTASASAAVVVNGDFETGNLDGWQVYRSSEVGHWDAYSGTTVPNVEGQEELDAELGPWFAPPGGNFAAVSTQEEISTEILSQTFVVPAVGPQTLSMAFYYRSGEEIIIPKEDTLDVESGPEENQQARVDVIKAGAPILTLAPSDILATPFQSREGDPTRLSPRTLSVDLAAFAGQAVTLRVAVAVTEAEFNVGVDDVGFPAPPPAPPLPPAPPSNVFSKGKLKLNKDGGTAKLTLTVPGPGVIKAVDAKKKKKVVKGAGVTAQAAGSVVIPIKPTGRGLKLLNSKGKLPFKVKVSFTPTGGTASTQPATGTLKLQG